jgi:Helix-turn-helix
MILKRFGEMSENDVSLRAMLADRLGIHRSQVTRWLASPSNLTLDTLSDLMLGMNKEVEVSAVRVGDGIRSNYSHPTSTIGSMGTVQSASASTLKTIKISNLSLHSGTGSQATLPQVTSK